MMHDFRRIEQIYLNTLELLREGKSINEIKLEAQQFVDKHDFDAATGLLKAISKHNGTVI